MTKTNKSDTSTSADAEHQTATSQTPQPQQRGTATAMPKEIGGRKGPEPTRYGDWERNGIISDF